MRSYLMGRYRLLRPDLDDSTVAAYGYSLTAFERWRGKPVTPADLTDRMLLEFIRYRMQTAARKTVKRERGDILVLWRAAARDGLCEPPGLIPTIRIPRRCPSSWRVDDYRKILKACHQLRGDVGLTSVSRAAWWYALMTFLYWVGCRISAATQLRWSDVDLEHGLVRLAWENAKTEQEQIVRLHSQVVEALRTIQQPIRPLVWPYPHSHRFLWVELGRILTAAGLPVDRQHKFHACRRTCYTLTALKAGKDAAGRQCGHKTDMSAYYLDWSQLPDIQACDVLPIL